MQSVDKLTVEGVTDIDIASLQSEIAELREKNRTLQSENSALSTYVRQKIDQLLHVVGTVAIQPHEFDDRELISLDPIGIITDSFSQVLQTLQQTNERLRLARDEISAIYNAVGAGIVVLDRDRHILSYNQRQKEIFFPQKRKVIGQTCVSILCRDKVAAPGCVFFKVMETGQRARTEEWAFAGRYFDVVGMPVKDRRGIVQQVVIVYHEITERKRVETELYNALTQAVEARGNTEAIINVVDEGMLVVDLSGVLKQVNPAAEKMLCASAVELTGQKLSSLLPETQLGDRWEDALRRRVVGVPFDICGVAADGVHRPLYQVRLALLFSKDNSIRGGVITLRDVTLERELERMKSEFVSTAAHELRTPLTTILGFAELLLDTRSFSNQERSEFIGLIHDKAEKLSELIDELLDISRIEAGQGILLDMQPTPLVPLAEGSLDFFRHLSPRHQFELQAPQAPVTVTADAKRIGQVFDNLLSNAVKYSPDGGRIALMIEPDAGCVRISVSDEGIGMSEEQVGRIFDKFYRVDASNTAVQGVGLGMTIVKEILEGHGSEVTVKSAPGRGTTVTFTLCRQGNCQESGRGAST